MDNNGLESAMTDLGIDLNSLDADLDFEGEAESMEAEGDATGEEVKTESVDDDSESDLNKQTPEGEEKKEEAPAEEAQEEAPAPTAKELQEIAAARTELEAKEKAFTDRIAAQEKEFQEKYHEKLSTHDQMDDFFAHLADKDPELFDLLKGEFQEHQKQYSNPVLDQFRKEQQELAKSVNEIKQRFSDEATRLKLDSEMNQVKSSLGKDAEAAGIKIDWEKVEDLWADNPKLNLEAAVYAMYGANLTKAMASKAKVETVEKKIQARPAVATAGSVSRSNTPTRANIPTDAFGAVRYFAKQLTGKA